MKLPQYGKSANVVAGLCALAKKSLSVAPVGGGAVRPEPKFNGVSLGRNAFTVVSEVAPCLQRG